MGAIFNKLFSRQQADLPKNIQHHLELRKRFTTKSNIDNTDFVAFDTELTGLDFKRDSIVSIGAVKLHGGKILPTQTYYQLVKPDSELNKKSIVVHEITHSDLDDARELTEVIEEFVSFIGDAVLIGHFVHIDINFVNKVLKNSFGISLQNYAVDTSTLHDWLSDNAPRLAQHFSGHTTKSDLFSLAEKYGIPVNTAHNAFEDAYITAQLFQRFLPFLPDCGIASLKELLSVARP